MKGAALASGRTAFVLFVFSVVGTALLAWTFDLTLDTIRVSEEREKTMLLAETLPRSAFDNNLVKDMLPLAADKLLNDEPSRAYRATLKGHPAAVVIETVAPDGYAGNIRLLVGILASGEISGVRVTAHKETPGLGDYIDAARSDWIHGFRGRSLAGTVDRGWAVEKDGGRFDYRAGATITARAVVRAVHRALQYFEKNRGRLLGNPAGEEKRP